MFCVRRLLSTSSMSIVWVSAWARLEVLLEDDQGLNGRLCRRFPWWKDFETSIFGHGGQCHHLSIIRLRSWNLARTAMPPLSWIWDQWSNEQHGRLCHRISTSWLEMLQHGLPRVHRPPVVIVNPFLIRLHLLDKHAMYHTLMYQFGIELATRVMNANIPFIYPVVTYGEEWVCTIYILHWVRRWI